MDVRKKKITPVLPSHVTTAKGDAQQVMSEDAVNKDNRGLYQNQMDKTEYWTYDSKTKEVVIMNIPKDPKKKAEVKEVVKDIPYDLWKFVRTCMKEFVIDDHKEDRDEKSIDNIGESVRIAMMEYAENGVTYDMSETYKGKYGHKFSYNYDMNRLECVDRGSGYTMGLSRPDWEDNKKYWVSVADKNVEEERIYS